MHVVDREVGTGLRERIIQVAFKARSVFLECTHAELRFLLIGDAFAEGARWLAAIAVEIRFRDRVATFEVAIVSAANHRVRMKLDLAALFDRLRHDLVGIRARHLDPINPKRELRPNSGRLLPLGEQVMCDILRFIGALLLEEEAEAFRGRELQRDLQHLRMLHRARDLMTARHRTHATVVLRAELDEVPRGRRVARRRDAHAHDVVARRPVARKAEGLIRIHKHILNGEEGARLGRRMLKIRALIRHTTNPVSTTLFIGMDLIGETELLR